VLSLAFIVKLYRHLWFKYISLFLVMKIDKVWKSLFSLIDLKKSEQLVKISIDPILCIKYICKRSLAMCLCWSWQIKHAFKSLSFLWRLSCWTLCFLVFNSSFDPFNSTFFIEILISWLFSFQGRLMFWDSSNLYFISITYINQLFGWVLCQLHSSNRLYLTSRRSNLIFISNSDINDQSLRQISFSVLDTVLFIRPNNF